MCPNGRKTESQETMTCSSGRKTEQECTVCEDGTYIRLEHEKVCDTCQHSPSKDLTLASCLASRQCLAGQKLPTVTTETDEWQAFWQYRKENYDSDYGPERKRCVGGFSGVYFRTDGLY